jgi:hypothetical protein
MIRQVLKCHDYLLDHVPDLVDLRIDLLLPVQQLTSRWLLEGRYHPVSDEPLVADPVAMVSIQENPDPPRQ